MQEMTDRTYEDGLQRRIDECQAILDTQSTGDPERPYFWNVQQVVIIDCYRRVQREWREDAARREAHLAFR